MQPDAPESFILLPLGTIIHNGSFAQWRDSVVAVLPVLLVHENSTTRRCWPSLARIAALAGVGKDSVATAIDVLERAGWLAVAREGRRIVYEMKYSRYQPGKSTSSNCIRLDHNFVLGGLWAAMPASAKRLYLVLRGLAWMGHRSDGTWHAGSDALAPEDCQPWAFLPAEKLIPSELARLSGLDERTERRARQWLLANSVVYVTNEYEQPGLILHYGTGITCPAVLQKLADISQEQKCAKGPALKAFRNMKKATSKKMNKSAKLVDDRTSEGHQPDTTGTSTGHHRSRTISEQSLNHHGQSGAEIPRNSARSLRLDLGLEAGITYRKPRPGLPLYGGPYPVTWTPSTARAQ